MLLQLFFPTPSRWGNWGIENINSFPKFSQLVNEAGMESWHPDPVDSKEPGLLFFVSKALNWEDLLPFEGLSGGTSGKELPANAGDIRDMGSIFGSRRLPGEGHGNPLQYSCLGDPLGKGTWCATGIRICFKCKRMTVASWETRNTSGS